MRLIAAVAGAGAIAAFGALACDDLLGLHEPTVGSADAAPADAAPGPFAPYVSGKRLRAEVYAIDGVRALHGWYDSMRNEECRFDYYGSPDGTHYCLPTSGDARGYFADAGCTVPAAVRFVGDPQPQYVIAFPLDACTAQPTVYTLGPVESGAQIYSGRPGACYGGSTQGTVYPANEVVTLGSFALARESVENRGGRIASYALAGDDGAREVISGYDQQRGEPCSVSTILSPKPVWAPSHYAFFAGGVVSYYRDDQCTQPLGTNYAPSAALCPITSIFVLDPDAGNTVRRAGPPVPGNAGWWQQPDAGCVPYSGDPREFVELGDAASSVATLEPASTVNVGAGRVRVQFDGTATEGAITPPDSLEGVPGAPSFLDTRQGATCTVQKAAGGALRCLPPLSASGSLVFADPSCTQLAVEPGESDSIALIQPTPEAGYVVYSLGQQLPQAYQSDSQGKCSPTGLIAYAISADITDQFESAQDLRE